MFTLTHEVQTGSGITFAIENSDLDYEDSLLDYTSEKEEDQEGYAGNREDEYSQDEVGEDTNDETTDEDARSYKCKARERTLKEASKGKAKKPIKAKQRTAVKAKTMSNRPEKAK